MGSLNWETGKSVDILVGVGGLSKAALRCGKFWGGVLVAQISK